MMQAGKYFGMLKEAVTSEAKTGSLQIVLELSVGHSWINGA